MYYFVAYTNKLVTSETVSIRQVVLDVHPFVWLSQKFKIKHIETVTLVSFQPISKVEFENFPGDKIHSIKDWQSEWRICCICGEKQYIRDPAKYGLGRWTCKNGHDDALSTDAIPPNFNCYQKDKV